MSLQSVTLQLPDSLIRKARQTAANRHQTLEQVLADWIKPLISPVPRDDIANVEDLEVLRGFSDDVLLGIARSMLAAPKAQHLEFLLYEQQHRALTEVELRESLDLVEEEDRLTLRKAWALHLLKQRGVPLPELAHSASQTHP